MNSFWRVLYLHRANENEKSSSCLLFLCWHIRRELSRKRKNPVVCDAECWVLCVQLCKHSWSLFIMLKGYTNYIRYTKKFSHTLYSFDYQCGNRWIWMIPFSLFMPYRVSVCIFSFALTFSLSLASVSIPLRRITPCRTACNTRQNQHPWLWSSFFFLCCSWNTTEQIEKLVSYFWWSENIDKWWMVRFYTKRCGLEIIFK